MWQLFHHSTSKISFDGWVSNFRLTSVPVIGLSKCHDHGLLKLLNTRVTEFGTNFFLLHTYHHFRIISKFFKKLGEIYVIIIVSNSGVEILCTSKFTLHQNNWLCKENYFYYHDCHLTIPISHYFGILRWQGLGKRICIVAKSFRDMSRTFPFNLCLIKVFIKSSFLRLVFRRKKTLFNPLTSPHSCSILNWYVILGILGRNITLRTIHEIECNVKKTAWVIYGLFQFYN